MRKYRVMPWSIEADEHTVYVHLSLPMPSVSDVLRGITQQVTAETRSVHLPAKIEGATVDDRRRLQDLWRLVIDAGCLCTGLRMTRRGEAGMHRTTELAAGPCST